MKITGRYGLTYFLSLTALLSAQSLPAKTSQQTVLKTSQPNFYVTTPQTGESTPVGEASSSRVVATATPSAVKASGYNTYLTNTPQPFAAASAPAASAPVSASRTSSRQSSARQGAASAPVSRQANTARVQVVSTSANYASGNQANYNTYMQTPNYTQAQSAQASARPTSGQQHEGLLNKLFHKPAAAGARVMNVSNSNAARASAAASTAKYTNSKLDGVTQSGQASWYGSDFHGDKTANGERYNMESMTAAHKTLPFGTMVCVRNERNGRECVVRINNRGPFIKGRILDVSKAAARELGMMGSGVAKVTMRVVGRSSS